MILHPDTDLVQLDRALETLNWVISHIYNSGILAEQLHPRHGDSLSATPLVWSHSVYIETVLAYLKRKTELKSPIDPSLIHEL